MQTIHWQAAYAAAPKALRHCKRCGVTTAFASSGLFRMNAQKQTLDMWLIYKCEICGYTWNMTVHSRVKSRSFPPEQLDRFACNDPALAARYAADTALLRRNGAEVLPPEVLVTGGEVPPEQPCEIHLTSDFPLEARIGRLLCSKLQISHSRLARLLADGRLRCLSGQDPQRDKLARPVVLRLDPTAPAKGGSGME